MSLSRWFLTFEVAVLVGIGTMLILEPEIGRISAVAVMVFSQIAVWAISYAMSE